jgi:hypothetical protein
MALPIPEVGLVIHFNYLWKREQRHGREVARYARPCAIVVAMRRGSDGALIVVVSPITHAPPDDDTTAIEVPPPVKRHLGLDEARSWVMTDEVNEFVWPGFDLQPNERGEIAYGMLPSCFFQRLRQAILDRASAGGLDRVRR